LTIHRSPSRLNLVRHFGKQIDRNGSLFATQRVAAHFILQRYLYLDLPPWNTDYAMLDLRDSWRAGTGVLDWLEKLRRLQREIEANPLLHLVAAEDGLLLYSRFGSPLPPEKLVERETLPPVTDCQIDLGSGVRIIGFTQSPVPGATSNHTERVRVTTFSTIAAQTNVDLAVRCVVQTGVHPPTTENFVSEFQPLGQGIWPISQWTTNRYYADDFIVTLPTGLAKEIDSVSFVAAPLTQ
jgi:hypothetical protein